MMNEADNKPMNLGRSVEDRALSPERRQLLKAGGLGLGTAVLGMTANKTEAASAPQRPPLLPGDEPITEPDHNPSSEYVFSISATIDKALTVGTTPKGQVRAIPITGGKVEGENIQGRVIPGGADWQLSRADGVTEIQATYAIELGGNTIVKVVNSGIIVPPAGDNSEGYFRTRIVFDAPVGEYEWLNRAIFLCKAGLHSTLKNTVLIEVFRLV